MGWVLGTLGLGGIGAALLFIPGLLPRAIEATGALLDVMRRNPSLAAIIALCAVCGWLWMDGSRVRQERDKWHTAWTAMDTAQKQAVRWAKAEAKRKDGLANDITKGANDVFKPTLAAGQAATARYADAHRCVRVGSTGGRVANPDLSGAVHPAGLATGAGGEADLVAVPESNLNICTANTVRLDNAVNVWAADMVAKGLAK